MHLTFLTFILIFYDVPKYHYINMVYIYALVINMVFNGKLFQVNLTVGNQIDCYFSQVTLLNVFLSLQMPIKKLISK